MKDDQKYTNIDLIQYLELDKKLSSVEIDELTTSLAQELWYRVLNEELPKKLTLEEINFLKTHANDLDQICQWVNLHRKDIDITVLINNVSHQLKKEFIITYQEDLRQTTDKK